MAICYKCGKKQARFVVYTPIMHFEYFLCEDCYNKYQKEVGHHVFKHHIEQV